MSREEDLKRALSEHPCYCEGAHRKFARMHIPVAPRCNIQCNYCNRKFDCCNESRPGVTSEVLSPEQAAEKIGFVKSRIPNLSVIGIAGPGDPLANEATFESLELISQRFPELTLCVSTNGLALPDSAERLHSLGVNFITVTMNACDPEIGARIYDSVILDGRRYTGVEGATILMERQLEGIEKCADVGMLVKVNIVMVPGINDTHIPELVKKVKSLGAYIVNILPLIPVEGTKFADMRAPTPKERRDLMDVCSLDARMMRHCRQCRADAIGMLDDDRSQEFVHFSGCGSGCGPSSDESVPNVTFRDPARVAVASSDREGIDGGFGNASVFQIYSIKEGRAEHVGNVEVDRSEPASGRSHRRHIENIISSLGDCGTVVVKEIGDMPMKTLTNLGMRVVVSEGSVAEALENLESQ